MKIQTTKIIQKCFFDEQDFPEEIKKEISNSTCVDTGLLEISHRWYETGVSVFDFNNSGLYFGIRHVSMCYPENMSISDADYTLEAFLMKKIILETYVIQ